MRLIKYLISSCIVYPFVIINANADDAESICRDIYASILDQRGVDESKLPNGISWSYKISDSSLVFQKGQTSKSIVPFDFKTREDCKVKVDKVMSSILISGSNANMKDCHVTDRPAHDELIPTSSPEMSGGHSQSEWCIQAIQSLKSANPNSVFSSVTSGESQRNSCSPFHCPLYTYHCTIRVHTDEVKGCAP